MLEPVTLAGHSPNEGRSLVLKFVQAEGAGLRIHDDDGAKVMLFRLLSEHPGLLSHHAIHLALAPLARLSDKVFREIIIVIRVLIFFVHGGGVDVDRMRLPIITCLRRIAVVPLSLKTPFCVPFGDKDDRVVSRLPGQNHMAARLPYIASILLVGGINGAAYHVLDYRHIVSFSAAGDRKLALTHPGQVGIARDRILRRLGDRNEW